MSRKPVSAVMPPAWRHPEAKHENETWLRGAAISEVYFLSSSFFLGGEIGVGSNAIKLSCTVHKLLLQQAFAQYGSRL